MKMSYILGGVASSAVIVAMAVVYMTAEKALAAVDPISTIEQDRHPEYIPVQAQPEPLAYAGPSLAPEDSVQIKPIQLF